MFVRIVCLSFALAGVACGGSLAPQAPAKEPTAASPDRPPLPRSSIAAVLLHRDELQLTDDQVKGMQEIDEKLAEHVATLREPAASGDKPEAPKPPPKKGSGFSLTGGGGGGGPGFGRAPHAASHGAKGAKSLQDQLDDADTHAYLEAEELLSDAQKEKARDIAEHYREELYDRRQSDR